MYYCLIRRVLIIGIIRQKYNIKKESVENERKTRKNHRRANGEGSISQRASDGRWQGEVIIGINPKTGKNIKKYVYGKTYQECLEKVQDLTYQIRKKTYFEPSKILFKDWLTDWLNTYRKNDLKPTTYSSYETNIRVHIIPGLGHVPICELTPRMIQVFLNSKYDEGLSAATVKKIYAVMKTALIKAVDSELILKNPIRVVTLRKEDVNSRNVLGEDEDASDNIDNVKIFTKEEQAILEKAIKGTYYYPVFKTLLYTGLRIGELTALKWQNVDLDRGLIHVVRTAVRVKVFSNSGKSKTRIVIQKPKTKKSIRYVPISQTIVDMLKEHQILQMQKAELRKQKNMPYQNKGFVFCAPNGNCFENRNILRAFHNILKKNNLPLYNLHSLRHTYASRLLEKNISIKKISELLGHSDAGFTANIYTHVLPSELKHTVDALEDIIIE